MHYLHWEGEREREGGGGGVGEMVRVRKSGRVFVNRMMSIYCNRERETSYTVIVTLIFIA